MHTDEYDCHQDEDDRAAAELGPQADAQPTVWPPLPEQGFLVGRAATQADVSVGNAAFAVVTVGRAMIGKPLPLRIPQYAFYKKGTGRIPVVIIQAEEVQGIRLIAARLATGGEVVGLITEFELLGNAPPKQ